ncbi:MAG: hypothetical protein GC200_10960 [Tepidisphaera sp.]|nr:hypothetical protein [Tepidisphaera sp.]
MDFDHPWSLLPALIFGMVGMIFFMQGKKNANLQLMALGAVLCVFPYFVASAALQWAIGAACTFLGFKSMQAELA